MDTEVYKLAPAEEPDLQTRMEQKRAELLAACRVVAKHVAWLKDVRERMRNMDGDDGAEALAGFARFLAAEIDALEYAE